MGFWQTIYGRSPTFFPNRSCKHGYACGFGNPGGVSLFIIYVSFPKIASIIGFSDSLFYFDATIVVTGFILFGKYLEMRIKTKNG